MNEKVKEYSDKMQKTIDHLQSEYAAVRAGRANPHVLDKIRVDYYGTPTPIQQVGNISVPDPRIIQIQPWEKNILKDIEKAIFDEVIPGLSSNPMVGVGKGMGIKYLMKYPQAKGLGFTKEAVQTIRLFEKSLNLRG